MNWQEQLTQVLGRNTTQPLLALDDTAFGLARSLLPPGSVQRLAPNAVPPAARGVALIIDALNALDAAAARARIAHVRNFIAPRLLVACDSRCALSDLDFIALGFDLLTEDKACATSLYLYDIETYKQVPDWLNARYWAHPERWKS